MIMFEVDADHGSPGLGLLERRALPCRDALVRLLCSDFEDSQHVPNHVHVDDGPLLLAGMKFAF